jgi:hypothetical protein
MRRKTCMRRRPASPEAGIAFVLALFAMVTLLLTITSALLIGSADIRATRNYRGASQVHWVAESAILEGLQDVDGLGVVNFQNDVVGQWNTLWGPSSHSFTPLPGFTYTVTPIVNLGNPTGAGQLIATATGPEGVRNTVVATVIRSNIPSTAPGAIYLASTTPTNASFKGNAFTIDGNDHLYTGGAGAAPPVPGLATRDATNTLQAINSLSTQQKSDVLGLGYSAGPPVTPSVRTSSTAPTDAELNQIINDLLARPGVVTDASTNLNGNVTIGTTLAPQITHFTDTGGVTLKANGNASGAGIMIVEGDLTIQGSFSFVGLILVRGWTNVTNDPDLTDAIGNATVYGSLWTEDINLIVGGSAYVAYSSQALALANAVSGGSALPSPLQVTSLADCADVPSGVGGCP